MTLKYSQFSNSDILLIKHMPPPTSLSTATVAQSRVKFCNAMQWHSVKSIVLCNLVYAVCDESSCILTFLFEHSATVNFWGTKVSNILYCTSPTGSSQDAKCGSSQIFGKWPVWLLLLQPLTAMEWNLLRHPTKLSTPSTKAACADEQLEMADGLCL